MERLSKDTIAKLPAEVASPSYNKDEIITGIVHFGIGNFHRAHQAVYCDALLNQGETNWGITGVSMRSSGMRDNLAPQDFLYTLATLGQSSSFRIVGAVQDVLLAPEEPQAIIIKLAHHNTQVVTTTITEKGYYLANGEINRDDPAIASDLKSLSKPKTTYGFLAAGLIKRSSEKGSPITILCCDNMHGGGKHLQRGVNLLLQRHSPTTIAWVKENVAFSSAMVDRVTPATNEELIQEVSNSIGLYDAAPVAAEPFTQWIIEDHFAGTRPPFDSVGAIFVDDIAPFERIKLRFLNAAHSMLAAMGYLAGDRFIHEALQRKTLAQFSKDALKNNVLPLTPAPENIKLENYIEQVFARFNNSKLPYAVLQVGTDSSQKIQQRWFSTIDDTLSLYGNAAYWAFALAAWVSFIRKASHSGHLNDPLKDVFANTRASENDSYLVQYLAIAGANKFAFFTNLSFMEAVEKSHHSIEEVGVEKALIESGLL